MITDKRIVRFLVEHEREMFALLKEFVAIPSGSCNKKGVDRVAECVQRAFAPNRVRCTAVRQRDCGDHLIVRSLAYRPGRRQVLLAGHMDTVFPPGSEYMWYREDPSRISAPGVVDMKGGLIAGIYALKALDSCGYLEEIPITFVFNSDEEIGSISSKELIRTEARQSAFALVLECGGRDGGVVTGRKGNMTLRLRVTGEAGHAAFAGAGKASAIHELAHKILALEAMNRNEHGLTVNVGKIKGGIGSNTVAEHAEAMIDARFVRSEDADRLMERIDALVDDRVVAGTISRCEVLTRRPAMPATQGNRGLLRIVEDIAGQIGVRVVEEFRFGVSDANIIAGEAIPVLDGLGPVGAEDHSRDEYLEKTTLLERAILLAETIVQGWQHFGEHGYH